eukprot:UN03039
MSDSGGLDGIETPRTRQASSIIDSGLIANFPPPIKIMRGSGPNSNFKKAASSDGFPIQEQYQQYTSRDHSDGVFSEYMSHGNHSPPNVGHVLNKIQITNHNQNNLNDDSTSLDGDGEAFHSPLFSNYLSVNNRAYSDTDGLSSAPSITGVIFE